MKHLIAAIFIGTLAACAGTSQFTSSAERPHLMAITDTVHRIYVEGTGSGSYVVIAEGYALTAAHVAGLLSGMSEDDRYTLVHADYDNDVALLQDDSFHCPCASVADQLPVVYSPVWAAGHPLGSQATILTEGRYQGLEDGSPVYTTPIAPGASGGGVFNADGELIGIISALPVLPSEVYAGPAIVTSLRARVPVFHLLFAVPLESVQAILEYK